MASGEGGGGAVPMDATPDQQAHDLTLLIEGQTVAFPARLARRIVLLRHAMEDSIAEAGCPVPLANVSLETFGLIREYLEQHADEPEPTAEERAEARQRAIDGWDAEFVQRLTRQQHFSLLLASNFLEIPSLLDLCGHALADLILQNKGSVRGLCHTVFDLEGIEGLQDFSEEERALLAREPQYKEIAAAMPLDDESATTQQAAASD